MNSINKYSRRALIARAASALPAAALLSLGWSSRGYGRTSMDASIDPSEALAAAANSDLIYVAGLKPDGTTSRCQAEVWFVQNSDTLWVVTAADSWRAHAARRGDAAKVWVGDVGRWQQSDGAYLRLPALIAQASIVGDDASHTQALTLFGEKYPASWLLWGPRFKNGLADGSRVLIRYQAQLA